MECLDLVTGEKKFLRTDYFRLNPWFKHLRDEVGAEEFDECYRGVYKLLSRMYFENYFIIEKVCIKKPEFHDVVLSCCDVYWHMDYFVNLKYDRHTDMLTVKRPDSLFLKCTDHYWPSDVYSRIIEHPWLWGIDIDDL